METTNAIHIERAELRDVPEILALQKLAFLREAQWYNDYTIEPLNQTLAAAQQEFSERTVLKAVADETIVGSGRAQREGATCHIQRIVVLPHWQGRGVATRVVRALEALFPDVERFELFTGYKSERNLALYRRLGYVAFAEKEVRPGLKFVHMEKRR